MKRACFLLEFIFPSTRRLPATDCPQGTKMWWCRNFLRQKCPHPEPPPPPICPQGYSVAKYPLLRRPTSVTAAHRPTAASMAFQSSSRLCLIDGSKSFSMVGPIGSTPLSQFFDIKRANTGNFVRNAGPMDTSIIFLTSRTRSFFGPEEEEARRQNPRWVHDLPPKPSLWDRVCFPLLSFLAWMRLLCDNFDRRFVAMVFCGVHLLKGFCGGLMVVEGLIYMRLHTGATSKTIFQAISQSAWGLKPLYALVSDTCAFRGYRRAPWVVLTAVVAAMAYTTLVLGNWSLSGPLVCLCFFCAKVAATPPLPLVPPPAPTGASEGEGPQRRPPGAVIQAVGGGCQSGWGGYCRLQVPLEAGTWRQGDSGWA